MRDVAICLLTAHRLDYALQTLLSVIENCANLDRVNIHIASDGDDNAYINKLVQLAADHQLPVTTSNSEGRGYGANWNKATQVIHQIEGVKYALPLEDDWELVRPLDLDLLVNMLEADPHVGCLRLGYLGYTDYLHVTMTHLADVMCGFLLPGSPEKHVFAGHPRLEKISWERAVGAWPEQEYISDPVAGIHDKIKPTGRKLNPGETELEVASRARNGIVWPFGLIPPELFAHIGTVRSY